MVSAKGKTLDKEGGYEMLRGVVKILDEVVREGHLWCWLTEILHLWLSRNKIY